MRRGGEKMIHELLLALSGYHGSIFTWSKRTGLQVIQTHLSAVVQSVVDSVLAFGL